MIEIVEGKPIRVEGREFVPVVRVETSVRRHALVGASRLAAQGGCAVRIRPIALVERNERGERRLPIPDRTGQLLSGLLLAAFVIPLLLIVAVRATRKK
jgi:hypothetical protein